MNSVKTVLLLGVMSGLLLAGGEIFGGRNGLYIALAIAVAMNFFGYFFSDKMALSMYSAQPVTPHENPDVYARVFPLVQSLTQRMSLPMPKLWLIQDPSPNAFATGRNPEHASVAFTAGVLQLMNDPELEGVVAHELGHVKNRDILTSSIAATIAAAITFLARMAFWFGGSRDDDERGNPYAALMMLILAPYRGDAHPNGHLAHARIRCRRNLRARHAQSGRTDLGARQAGERGPSGFRWRT